VTYTQADTVTSALSKLYWLCCIYTGPRYTKYTLLNWSIQLLLVQNEVLGVAATIVPSVAREN
jgi:hypothetical protein